MKVTKAKGPNTIWPKHLTANGRGFWITEAIGRLPPRLFAASRLHGHRRAGRRRARAGAFEVYVM